jgi:hypothetical protein
MEPMELQTATGFIGVETGVPFGEEKMTRSSHCPVANVSGGKRHSEPYLSGRK